MKITIKNMVCPRCVEAVKQVLSDAGISFDKIVLGEVNLSRTLDGEEKALLSGRLKAAGFELLEGPAAVMIAGIKSIIIEQIHHSIEPLKVNFSTLLADKLNHDYSYLSRLFSSVEGVTIEKYVTAQKVERVKELLIYDELTLSEIAHKMNYSSVAYLAGQFKRETGQTTSAFKAQRMRNRRPIDQI